MLLRGVSGQSGLALLREVVATRTGWAASAAGHVLLLAFLLFGGAFTRTPLPPLEVAEVTVISEEEFAMLTRPETAEEAGAGMTAPEPPEAPADVPSPPDRPEVAETPFEEVEPTAEPLQALPEPTAPPPAEVPPTETPVPQAVPRVAPEVSPEAPDEAAEAPVVTERVAPSPAEEVEVPVEEREAEAPPEATTEIVTEAEEPGGAPDAVSRPRARPDRVARLDPGRSFEAASVPEPAEERPAPAETETELEPADVPAEDDPLASAVAAAVAEAVSNAPEAAPTAGQVAGPPLSQGEREAFRVAVERCWIVDPGSPAAAVTVIVGMRMTRDAKPDTASIDLLGAQGGDDSAVRTAYEAARRAILRCGADGFPLPPEKYERWAQVELTFNPEGMRVR